MNTYTKPVTNRLRDAGSRDVRITIQEPTETANEFGEAVTTWGDLATVWAGKRHLQSGSGERFEGNQHVVTTSVVFNIRHSSAPAGFNEKCRILYDSEYYDILNLRYVGREREIDIVAEKRI